MVELDTGSKTFRRTSSRRSLRRASRTPSLTTVWEFSGSDIVDAVPATEDVLQEASSDTPVRGRLWLRQTGLLPVRLFPFGRRPFLPRFAVLSSSTAGSSTGPPRLQLFLVRLSACVFARSVFVHLIEPPPPATTTHRTPSTAAHASMVSFLNADLPFSAWL